MTTAAEERAAIVAMLRADVSGLRDSASDGDVGSHDFRERCRINALCLEHVMARIEKGKHHTP